MIGDLLAARSEAKLLPQTGLELDEAYAVGAKLHQTLVEQGYTMAGRKVGFTNESIWPELGLTEPMWAPIYEETVRFDDSVHALAGSVGPRIELEVVVELVSVSPLQIGWAALGFEIVQCHFPDWKFSCADAVADFGLHRALHVGAPLGDARRLEEVAVSLSRNGEIVARGSGSDVLGGPLNVLDRLAAILARQPDAPPLRAGEIVTTGTMTGAIPVVAGERWEAAVTGGPALPGLSIAFSD